MRVKVFLLSILFLCISWPNLSLADIEPPRKDVVPLYTLETIVGAGQVQIQKVDTQEWVNAKEGATLEEGDSLKVGSQSSAILSLKDDTFVQVNENSSLTVKTLGDQGDKGFISRLALGAGRILSDVRKNLGLTGSVFEVESGGVVCGVRGTVFEVSNAGGDVETTTHEGAVQVQGSNGNQTVKAGETCHCHHGQYKSKEACSEKAHARFTAWKAAKARCLAHRAALKSSHPFPHHSNAHSSHR
jgi:hypothetical protein